MSDITVTASIDLKPLEALKAAVEKRIAKKAMRAGIKPILQAVRGRAPRRTGGLIKSMSSKVDSVKGGVVAYGVVGPRSKYWFTVKKGKGKGRKVKPSRYAHLADRRTPFLKPSLTSTQAQAVAIINQVYAAEIAAVATT